MGCPTCADDVLLLASTELEAQIMLDTARDYARTHRDSLNPSKTTATLYNANPVMGLELAGDTIDPSEEYVHLGIQRSIHGTSKFIDEKISLGRRMAYSLMPASLYGQGGLSPEVAKIIQT